MTKSFRLPFVCSIVPIEVPGSRFQGIQRRIQGVPLGRRRAAFTLVELLVVVAIIGILIALLFPAIQAVREVASKAKCANQVRQLTMAMIHYEHDRHHFPPGFSHPQKLMWSGAILPHLEQQVLYDTLDRTGTWNVQDSPNGKAQGFYMSVFQCPSAQVDREQFDPLPQVNRVPSCYLACASGLNNRESGEKPWVGMAAYEGLPASDGVFYMNSETRNAEIRDGLSQTVLVGEAYPDQYYFQNDYSDNPQKVDHWYIGSEEVRSYLETSTYESNEVSECLGSTACPINALKDPDLPMNDKELGYSSMHWVGVNMGFADGHVDFIAETVDRRIWSAMGSRNGQETNVDPNY